ncbi:MAG TPA: GAF domain-containing protein [Drouetiella sp.]
MSNSTYELHASPATDVESCAQEQIHIPGSVQSFGSLLVFDYNHCVTRVSQNINQIVGVPAETLLGLHAKELLHVQHQERIRKAFDSKQNLIRITFANGAEHYALCQYLGDEFYLDILHEPKNLDPVTATQRFVAALSAATTPAQCAQAITDEVRALTNFDRVKLYKFDASWNGEVIAESRADGVPSYLGLHFPESDIPVQARELYIRNRVRVIGSVNDPQSQIVQKTSLPPLDLSFSFIRSVSPIHLQYLRNMDVMASLSISIFQNNKFWGLIACHNRTPRTFDTGDESFFKTVSLLASSRMTAVRMLKDTSESKDSLAMQRSLVPMLTKDDPKLLLSSDAGFDRVIPSNGFALVLGEATHCQGVVPEKSALVSLVEWLERGAETTFSCEDLPARFGATIGQNTCGLLAAKIPQQERSWLMWFRVESPKEVSWAGDPYKPTESTEYGTRLYPRTSFAIWNETQRGRSQEWRQSEIQTSEELANLLVGSKLVAMAPD